MDKYYHFITRNRVSRFLYGLFNEYCAYLLSNSSEENYKKHNKFLIYGQGRTGSTLLVNSLNSHPQIFCEREIFMDKNLPFDHQVSNYKKMMRGKSSIFRQKVYGFKVKIYQLTIQEKIKTPEDFLLHAKSCGWKILFLYRENLFEHVLSNLVAESLQQYHFGAKSDKKKYTQLRLDVNTTELVSRMKQRQDLSQAEELSLVNIPHFRIQYEELASSLQQVCSDIFEYLGLCDHMSTTVIQKTNTKQYSELISNFDEVVEALLENNFDQYLSKDRV